MYIRQCGQHRKWMSFVEKRKGNNIRTDSLYSYGIFLAERSTHRSHLDRANVCRANLGRLHDANRFLLPKRSFDDRRMRCLGPHSMRGDFRNRIGLGFLGGDGRLGQRRNSLRYVEDHPSLFARPTCGRFTGTVCIGRAALLVCPQNRNEPLSQIDSLPGGDNLIIDPISGCRYLSVISYAN